MPNTICAGGHLKRARLTAAAALYAVLLLALWIGFRQSEAGLALGGHFLRAFASFAFLLAPIWFFGFGAAELFQQLPRWNRIALTGLLASAYFVFAAGTPDWRWPITVVLLAFPMLLAIILEIREPSQMVWQDVIVLAIIVAVYYSKLLQVAWPLPGLAFFPKVFLADVLLYGFLVNRNLQAAGYALLPTWSTLTVGLREWTFFLPIAVLIGESTRFIHLHPVWARPGAMLTSMLLTFLLIAIPEELFFRSILQNLLETRFGRTPALLLASLLFGLSHFNHGGNFNWRYVLLASIAGIFYGRAWRTKRQILASVVTHTLVDVVWSLWFR